MSDNQQLQREKQLYDYLDAFERGDIQRMQVILRLAERDPELSRMIREVHAVLDGEVQSNHTGHLTEPHKQNGSHHMSIQALPYRNDETARSIRPRQSLPLTLVATLAVMALVSAVLLSIYLNREAQNNTLSPLPAQADESTQLAIFQRYIDEVWNDADPAAVQELVSPSHVYIEVGNSDGPVTGSDALLKNIQDGHDFAPGYTIQVDDAIEDGDRVWAVVTITNDEINNFDVETFTPSTGDHFVSTGTMIVTFEEGKIAETRFDFNATNMLWDIVSQMGVDEFSMQEQDNLAVVERIVDELLKNPEPDVEVVRELYSRSFYIWSGFSDEATNTSPGLYWRTNLLPMRHMMPDLTITVHSLAAGEDRVMMHYSASGTWTNPLCFEGPATCSDDNSIPPTGEPLSWTGTTVYRLEDGKVVEQWDYMDASFLFTALDQMGVEIIWPEDGE